MLFRSWGGTVPNATWCPWNYFRTSGDVEASYASVVGNLQTTIQWAQKQLSAPGCWGYPDMLEVGVAHGPHGAGDPGLSPAETRSHFNAWCIVSSPLILSMDLNNATIMENVWPIIANTEALAVNKAWAGNSGTVFKAAPSLVKLGKSVKTGEQYEAVPSWQYFYKPLSATSAAVLLMNHAATAADFTLSFADVPGLSATTAYKVRDVNAHADLGSFTGTWSTTGVASHDSVFLVLTAA